MVSTRAASQPQTAQAPISQPPVDKFNDADLTDVEGLERPLAASTGTASTGTAGEQTQPINTTAGTQQQLPLQPENEPQNATLPLAQQIAHLLQGLQAPAPQPPQTSINDTVLTTLTQAVTALTALTTGARPGPIPLATTAGEDPRIEPIRSRFPAVDPALLVEILENRFKVENLLKLNASFIYTPGRRQENIYLGSIEVPTSRREVKLDEYHNLSWLMEPFEIYCQVLVEFAHEHIKVPLADAYMN
jgi:hypothetical protein